MREITTMTPAPDTPNIPISHPPVAVRRRYQWPRSVFLVAVGMIGLFVLGYIVYTAQSLPPLAEIENPQSSLSTQLISADGEVLDNFFSKENRVNVHLNEVSPHVIDALIAMEDARFYQHAGVDYWSLPSLIYRNLSGTTSGGSTITMQLARNLFNSVGKDRTLNRKIKEIIVSTVLERSYTKQEILEAYLNTVNIFGNAYGIEMASERLFGKQAKFLSIEESAVLVAMLKGQGVFDPLRRQDTVLARRNLVMKKMHDYGFIALSDLQLDSLQALPLHIAPQGQDHVKGVAPYFRQRVREFLREWCSQNRRSDGELYDMYQDGLRVYTTLDAAMQRHAEAAVKEHLTPFQAIFDLHLQGREPWKQEPQIIDDLLRQSDRYRLALKAGKTAPEIEEEFNTPVRMAIFSWEGEIDTVMTPRDSVKWGAKFLETGMVSIDPSTGYIKVWVGGINFEHFKYDHVDQGKRQVGSTFKPFVYAAAIDRGGRTPCDQELNQPIVFENVDGEGTRWSPKNADGQIGGYMTLRKGLATSTNLITARLMASMSPQVVARYARDMGIKTPLDEVPSLCLGTTDLKVLELTGAYCTFANQGTHIEPIFVTRIEDKHGNVLWEHPREVKQVLSAGKAYMMVELLRGVVDEPGGTAGRLRYRFKFRNEMGGKTGTTQNHSDGWFIGMTPHLVSGVWVGCADRRVRFRSLEYGQGASMALPIWALFMKKIYEDESIGLPENATFERPKGHQLAPPCVSIGSHMRFGNSDSLGAGFPSTDDLDGWE